MNPSSTLTASTTRAESNIQTIEQIYAAFGRGDVTYIMAQLTDDISWDEGVRVTDLPWFQSGQGSAHVLACFQALVSGLSFSTFDVQSIVGNDEVVVGVVREIGTIVSTGKPVDEDLFVHIWKLDSAGKVYSFRHVGDLARHEAPFHA